MLEKDVRRSARAAGRLQCYRGRHSGRIYNRINSRSIVSCPALSRAVVVAGRNQPFRLDIRFSISRLPAPQIHLALVRLGEGNGTTSHAIDYPGLCIALSCLSLRAARPCTCNRPSAHLTSPPSHEPPCVRNLALPTTVACCLSHLKQACDSSPAANETAIAKKKNPTFLAWSRGSLLLLRPGPAATTRRIARDIWLLPASA